jgi:hypothetical protein
MSNAHKPLHASKLSKRSELVAGQVETALQSLDLTVYGNAVSAYVISGVPKSDLTQCPLTRDVRPRSALHRTSLTRNFLAAAGGSLRNDLAAHEHVKVGGDEGEHDPEAENCIAVEQRWRARRTAATHIQSTRSRIRSLIRGKKPYRQLGNLQ